MKRVLQWGVVALCILLSACGGRNEETARQQEEPPKDYPQVWTQKKLQEEFGQVPVTPKNPEDNTFYVVISSKTVSKGKSFEEMTEEEIANQGNSFVELMEDLTDVREVDANNPSRSYQEYIQQFQENNMENSPLRFTNDPDRASIRIVLENSYGSPKAYTRSGGGSVSVYSSKLKATSYDVESGVILAEETFTKDPAQQMTSYSGFDSKVYMGITEFREGVYAKKMVKFIRKTQKESDV